MTKLSERRVSYSNVPIALWGGFSALGETLWATGITRTEVLPFPGWEIDNANGSGLQVVRIHGPTGAGWANTERVLNKLVVTIADRLIGDVIPLVERYAGNGVPAIGELTFLAHDTAYTDKVINELRKKQEWGHIPRWMRFAVENHNYRWGLPHMMEVVNKLRNPEGVGLPVDAFGLIDIYHAFVASFLACPDQQLAMRMALRDLRVYGGMLDRWGKKAVEMIHWSEGENRYDSLIVAGYKYGDWREMTASVDQADPKEIGIEAPNYPWGSLAVGDRIKRQTERNRRLVERLRRYSIIP